MVLQKLRVSQNFSRIHRSRILVFFGGYLRLAVSFFIRRGVSESRFFARLRISKSRFVCFFLLKWRLFVTWYWIILKQLSIFEKKSTLTSPKKEKKKANERILPFATTHHPAVSNLKQTLMEQWSLIQNQPLLKTIYLKPPIISCKRGKSLKDTLVRSKIGL